ncbi:hypothetical protein OROGR_011156 [Orobanche gracilis]
MGKIRIEVCLISARGLRRNSCFHSKLQWFAVGWIDPDSKYCTNIDSPTNANPVWQTKFSRTVDPCSGETEFQDLALHVEVYSIEPFFLRKSLLGSADVVLREFLDKYDSKSGVSNRTVEEIGSFQLRKKKSNKPVGFIDVSIRVSEEREEEEPGSSYTPHSDGGGGGINLDSGYGYLQAPTPHLHPNTSKLPENDHFPHHHRFAGANHSAATWPDHYPNRPPSPSPPPPPSDIGYTPTCFPMHSNYEPNSYVNMPSSVAPPRGRGTRPGFGMGIGAGALAAGSVIFGDDFMSGLDVPGRLDDARAAVSNYSPF